MQLENKGLLSIYKMICEMPGVRESDTSTARGGCALLMIRYPDQFLDASNQQYAYIMSVVPQSLRFCSSLHKREQREDVPMKPGYAEPRTDRTREATYLCKEVDGQVVVRVAQDALLYQKHVAPGLLYLRWQRTTASKSDSRFALVHHTQQYKRTKVRVDHIC